MVKRILSCIDLDKTVLVLPCDTFCEIIDKNLSSCLLIVFNFFWVFLLISFDCKYIVGFLSILSTDNSIWNFLYHCRNAAAHNNKFKIEKDRFPAKWRNLEIIKSIGRAYLFPIKEEKGFLNFGDPIALLWDIEQKCPKMVAKE